MNRNLLKTIGLALLCVVGASNVWAGDYDGTSPVYSPTNGTNYATFADAMTAFNGLDNGSSFEIHLYADVTLASRVTVNNTKSLTIVPKAAVSIKRGSLNRTTAWIINTSTGTVNLGSADYAITFDGVGHADNQRIFKNILGNESTGRMNIENVTFQNYKFDTENSNLGYLFLNKNANGKLVLKNVTVSNCVTTEDAFIKSISTNNDNIYLQGAINFNSCVADNGAYMSIMGRIRLGEVDGSSSTTITTSNPISIYWAGSATSIGTAVIVKAKKTMLSSFNLTNEILGLFGNDTDLKLTQAYTLSVSDAGAATLVLPFDATFPADTKCYTLHYTAGNDKVSVTEVETTLAANTPVLINAAEGKHKFVSTATSGDAATGSDPVTVGALTGVYADTYCPSASYILGKKDDVVGFYHPAGGNTNYVRANRAYLTADGAGAREFLSIDFDGETTALSEELRVKSEKFATAPYYNLNGQRVAQPVKGLYIVNGKKVIIK